MTDMLTGAALLAVAALVLIAVPVYAESRWHKRRPRGRHR